MVAMLGHALLGRVSRVLDGPVVPTQRLCYMGPPPPTPCRTSSSALRMLAVWVPSLQALNIARDEPSSLHQLYTARVGEGHGGAVSSLLYATPPPQDLLERGGGRGGGGPGGPPPCRNIPNPQGTEKSFENEEPSTWNYHVVGRKQRKFIIECQFRVPTSHQYTTTTTKRDIHHLMPNDSDVSCQSELDSPELELPSEVEVEREPCRVWPFFVP